MQLDDSLPGLLYLGELSRKRLKYCEDRRAPDHTWSEFPKIRAAMFEAHPELKQPFESYMGWEKKKWGENFTDTLKLRSIALFAKQHIDI